MRTTLTIDDDIAARIEALRRERGLSYKKAVNALLRDGLEHQTTRTAAKRYRTKPRKISIRPSVDPTKLNQFADELEAEAFQEKHSSARK
ncbi:MAG: ribbon-helix-helix protein, CopG family [Gammaproteobacteria bacterium]